MSDISAKNRNILQSYYDEGPQKRYAAYGQDALSEQTAQRCFGRLHSGNFDVKDTVRAGRPITKASVVFLLKLGKT